MTRIIIAQLGANLLSHALLFPVFMKSKTVELVLKESYDVNFTNSKKHLLEILLVK